MSSTHSAVKTNKAPNATPLNAHNVFTIYEKQNYIAKLCIPIFVKFQVVICIESNMIFFL